MEKNTLFDDLLPFRFVSFRFVSYHLSRSSANFSKIRATRPQRGPQSGKEERTHWVASDNPDEAGYPARWSVKPGSQYISRDVVRPEVIIFSMGFAASRR